MASVVAFGFWSRSLSVQTALPAPVSNVASLLIVVRLSLYVLFVRSTEKG